ncbi:class I SAM-dependent methyltransferase [Bacillus sp. 31A1R]|uniref:Class I SAM-dependent methyltransferase n=1 Tax=Robertmurraya mangrovi TaxID=3098077 RepID=A0ABU5IXU3_9BACI|nr:class I SAM-dependent methyltransferase [Bacillus sp. 31A1R]MDZ5471975.1 class I SAM-dependent methyltransferase [Bacillus sp. 31A1R]
MYLTLGSDNFNNVLAEESECIGFIKMDSKIINQRGYGVNEIPHECNKIVIEHSIDFMNYFLFYQHNIDILSKYEVTISNLNAPGIETPFWTLFSDYNRIAELTQGYLTLGDVSGIITLVLEGINRNKLENIRALEIGSWTGFSSYFISKTINTYSVNNKLTCVDTWGDVSGSAPRGSYADYVDVLHLFRSVSKGLNTSNLIRSMAMTSFEALNVLRDDIYNFIFIDGDHRYQATYYEILYSILKAKIGAVIFGHDYRHYNNALLKPDKEIIELNKNEHITYIDGREFEMGVIAAVDEIFEGNAKLVTHSSVWYKEITQEDKDRAKFLISQLENDPIKQIG